ncbi:unnamed protein product [Trichobilharzia szidati]|nr:unnamed protein product [Trichobilharzia szidati]
MACVPLFNRQQSYNFEVTVKLHSLTAVPYVNSVTFAKLRLLSSRNSAQYSPRTEIRNNIVTWNSEHRFHCKFKSDAETTILEPNILKVSIRMETKGGKSFYKVGFVSINLACFAAVGNVINRRRYILEGYDEKRKRQDNSLLSISFCLRQLTGDNCFRTPKENLSNCLIEPPDYIDLPETDSKARDYSLTNCTLIGDSHNNHILNTSMANQEQHTSKPITNTINTLTNPLDILHSLNLDTVSSSCPSSTSSPPQLPISSLSMTSTVTGVTTTGIVGVDSIPSTLSSIASGSSKLNYSTSSPHYQLASWDTSSAYPVEWNFLSQPSVARNDLISVQMNTNQTPNLPKLSSHQSDVFRSSSGGRVSTSSSNTPISNSMSSTPGSASIGSLLPRSPPVQKTDKTIPPSQDETVTATKAITIPIELDKPQHDIIGDKLPPVSSQNVTFNPLTSDSVTCYSLPHPHHLSKPYMNVGIPSENPIDIYYPNNESDEIGDMYSNYGKKSYDYFATDSVLLVRSSRRRKIRPDLQVMPSMNTNLKSSDPPFHYHHHPPPPPLPPPSIHSTVAYSSSHYQGNENDSALSSISSSTTAGVGAGAPVASTVLASTSPATVVVHTIGPSGMISKSSMTTDCCSSGYQSHSRQSSLES